MSRTLELTRELVARPSITPNDAGCQQLIAERLIPLGFAMERTGTAAWIAQESLDGRRSGPVTEEEFNRYLYAPDLPQPDLLIRTGADQRISNFLLWQLAYTELYFTDTLWPAFDEQALQEALDSYTSRQRRFGRTGEQVEQLKGA